jgi:uncharacterized protein YndB with AHSA1/START domain
MNAPTSPTVHHARTRTISIAAAPERVFALVSDGRRLPDWAPAFAGAVTHEHGDVWSVESDRGRLRTLVRAAPAQGTVDIVSADAPTRGLFTRVVPNHRGSELIFSLFFPDGTEPVAIDAQMATIERELRAVRDLVERDDRTG